MTHDYDLRPGITAGQNKLSNTRHHRGFGHSPTINLCLKFSPLMLTLGPFANVDRGGFETAYLPERTLDFSAECEGRDGKSIRWQRVNRPDGMMLLNDRFDPHVDTWTRTDVRPIVAEARRQGGASLSPLSTYRALGYREAVVRERGASGGATGL